MVTPAGYWVTLSQMISAAQIEGVTVYSGWYLNVFCVLE